MPVLRYTRVRTEIVPGTLLHGPTAINFTVCEACGCFVYDIDAHTDWHTQNVTSWNRLIELIQGLSRRVDRIPE